MKSDALALFLFLLTGLAACAQPFLLPTANDSLFKSGGEEKFFVGTVGKPWMSGTFGCVRSEGGQMHEGIDIRCLSRDKRGEPVDPVLATAEGKVVYINKRTALSNYGNYVILRHQIEGLEIYSLYAHLREIRAGLEVGQTVRPGEQIAVLGRTSNTREGISKERAHVHFELDLVVNDRFPAWYKKTFPKQRNDHGVWNGQNLLGLDPRSLLLAQHKQGGKFSLLDFLRDQSEFCRVLVRDTEFPWLKRHSALVRRHPAADKHPIAGYEMALNFNGVPFELIPRHASEMKTKARFQLLSVDEAEYRKNPCRRLVVKKGNRWELANNGLHLLDLLTY